MPALRGFAATGARGAPSFTASPRLRTGQSSGTQAPMRAEAQSMVKEIEESLELLRRRL
jgi:hypothetical protein